MDSLYDFSASCSSCDFVTNYGFSVRFLGELWPLQVISLVAVAALYGFVASPYDIGEVGLSARFLGELRPPARCRSVVWPLCAGDLISAS